MPDTGTQSGFSLIELVVVLVVIGLALAAGVPAFSAYRRSMLLDQVRQQLLQDLRAARQMAGRSDTLLVSASGMVYKP